MKKVLRNRKCDGKRCWICEKAGVIVSKELHDYIQKQNVLLSKLSLGFNLLGTSLISEEGMSRMFNGYTEPFAGDARYAAAKILAARGAR